MMRCAVFGGNGFIGSHLVEALSDAGHETVVFGRPHSVRIPELSARPNVTWCHGDFINEEAVEEALIGCEVVFHLISTTLPKSSSSNPIYDVETNIGGTLRLLDAAVRHGVRKVVFLSSGGTVYGIPQITPITESHPTEPICSYGITKLAIEKYLHLYHVLHGLDYCVLRLSNPYGERQHTAATQGAIAVFLGKALRGEPVEIWGDGSVVRDYIHIADTTRALVAAIDCDSKQRVLNIGSGEGRSLCQILDEIECVTGQSVSRRYLAARPFDVPVSVLSIENARKHLGWEPQISFRDGLIRTAAWLSSNLKD